MNEKTFNNLLKWNRDKYGHYNKDMKGQTYSLQKNPCTRQWHLYVEGEWSVEIRSVRFGKLFSVAIAHGMDPAKIYAIA